MLYESDRVLAVAAYLKGDTAAWFKPTLREFLEKGYASRCKELVKKTFSYYSEFKRRLKEAFSNLDKARD